MRILKAAARPLHYVGMAAFSTSVLVPPSITIPVPDGTQLRDQLRAYFLAKNNNSQDYVWIPPDGWALDHAGIADIGGTGRWQLRCYARSATASEPASYTWTVAAGSVADIGGMMIALRSVRTTGVTGADITNGATLQLSSRVLQYPGRSVLLHLCGLGNHAPSNTNPHPTPNPKTILEVARVLCNSQAGTGTLVVAYLAITPASPTALNTLTLPNAAAAEPNLAWTEELRL